MVAIILAILSLQTDPPPDLLRQVAQREAETEAVRSQYLYRQSVHMEEFDQRGRTTGAYKELREVIFSPTGERTEQFAEKPSSNLQRLILTDEDFQDIRNIQPLLLTPDLLPRYQVKFRGEEAVDGVDCWVLSVQPRQILQGMRLFEGEVWVDKKSLGVVRTYGQAVPPIYSKGRENLFPRFSTLRRALDGTHYFPVLTYADDTLPFKAGPLRIKLTIRYSSYRKFGTETTITFDPPIAK
ncbi:hypothetical protein [uncultured Paludibaculum sp.]|uniref:hypothetical protein n=1 Tax=uncultured Paludibaculum sp. TaxID=1765020 RepID=UPI002AAC4913|nr:hypothetical protein [uncultured Paludibaculum sp.]